MPIIKSNSQFDFTNATLEEKKDLIKKLLRKQKDLANILLENYPNNIELRVHLIFVETVCSSTFGEYFSGFVPNRVFDENEFASLFATKLDKYMSLQSQNYCFLNFISKLIFF